MLSTPDAPSFNEWVMLIQKDTAQARQLLIMIKVRNKQQGLFADPSLEISIEDYDRALRTVTAAAADPAQAEDIDHVARIGRATAGPYPDREGWRTLIKDDPDFAQELYGALQAKQAMFGLQTPQAIIMSIAAYASVSSATK